MDIYTTPQTVDLFPGAGCHTTGRHNAANLRSPVTCGLCM